MKIKDLFVIDNNKEGEVPKKEEAAKPVNKFPSTEPKAVENASSGFNFGFGKTTPSQPVIATSQASPEQIAKTLQVYQDGLKGLKQAGYDFQNFYDALSDEDKTNPAAYQMGVKFASSMDKSVTKDRLVQSADFYIGKIQENYNNYVTSGNNRKQDVLRQKTSEGESLNANLEMLEQQLQAIQNQINDNKNQIASIDSKYNTQLCEIDSKLAANDIARNQIVGSLELVKQGIINNVK